MDTKNDGAQQPPENRLARKRRAEEDPLHSESKIPYLSDQQAEINPLQSESEIPSQSQQKAEENPLKSESEIPSQSQQKAEENPLKSESEIPSQSQQKAEEDPLISESKIPSQSQQKAEENPLHSESEIPSQSQQKAEEDPVHSKSEIPSQSQQKAEEDRLLSESEIPSQSQQKAEENPLHSESKIPSQSQQKAEEDRLLSESEIPSQSQQKAEGNPLHSESEISSQLQQKAEEDPLHSEAQISSSSEQQANIIDLTKVPLSKPETVAKKATSREAVLEETVQMRNIRVGLNKTLRKRYDELIDGPPNCIIIDKFNLQIKPCDIETLMPGNWINDNIMNFFLEMIMKRSNDCVGELPQVYAFNTYFMPRLQSSGYQGVRRWTRNVDVLGKDILLIPIIYDDEVWCMVIIDLRNKTIRYYDSTLKTIPICKTLFESYLKEESMDKRNQPLDTTEFQFEAVKDLPKQKNQYDSGTFSLMFAEYASRDAPITFTQKDMEYSRTVMVFEVSSGELWTQARLP